MTREPMAGRRLTARKSALAVLLTQPIQKAMEDKDISLK